ncbi:PREDICTED: cytochrome P450 6a2-like [Rhagoletis zephyria]|uniref:cytochrome P450 6a2-like n=1 Tax=Rhagoletis zephyria TaxID=28612 RepID=UPI00081183E1|nr:PREDICTED: cytochrome P450 6a2-like [Rhagoletis zephyria]
MAYLSLWIPLYLFLGAATLLFVWCRKRLNYWAERGIVHDKPSLLYGSLSGVGRTQALRDPFYDCYNKYKHAAPFGGFHLSMRVAAIIFDLDLVKHVLVKDFANFSSRGAYYNEKDDPISGHVFNLDGEKWRSMRTKLTPTFTSAKMKFMFPTVVKVANEFVNVLRHEAEKVKETTAGTADVSAQGIEIRDLLARFTTDVIGSCAFGLECNSLHEPNTQFRVMGKKIFSTRRNGRLAFGFAQAYPELARKIGLKFTPEDVSDFFRKVVRDTAAYREKEGIQRNDFMNLLLDLKDQGEDGLTLEQITAQAFVFFIAGFETSSSTMGFALYELALNQEMQTKAREEIRTVLARHDGQFTYECMRDMKYLHQILCETLRKYSVASITMRKTLNDYRVPNTKYVIEKGVIIVIPVDAIHRDPEIYPDPDRFDPARFEPEAIAKRHPMAWLPFGEGPRNCIGLRFGKMQAMVGLALLLKHFKFSLAPRTKVPLEIKKEAFVLTSQDGIHVHVEPIVGAK